VRLPSGGRFGVGRGSRSSTRRSRSSSTSRPRADRRSSSSACSKRDSDLAREGLDVPAPSSTAGPSTSPPTRRSRSGAAARRPQRL